MELDEDIFSCILSHIAETRTLYLVLTALPPSHLLFPSALARLWQLPVYLDSYDSQVAAASQKVLDYLLEENAAPPLAESVRHLVVAVEQKSWCDVRLEIPAQVVALHERLPHLLRRTTNLESLEYHNFPGLDMKSEHVQALQNLRQFRRFAVDCALFSRDREIPASGGPYAVPGDLSAEYDTENWELEPFISTVGPKITSLDLRHVNQTMFTALIDRTGVFALCHNLEYLKMDITEGVWDWTGGGSPSMGAEPGFTFPFLGFPSVERFELIVCDKTLTGSARGPMDLVHSKLLTSLTIDVRHSIFWMAFETIKVFEALSPLDFPVLSFLEIKDHTRNTRRYYWESADNSLGWSREGRAYPGFVSSFLGAISTGALPNLATLWVDERVLLPRGISVQNLLAAAALPPSSSYEPINIVEWTRSLRATLAQLVSLRVGFGAIDDVDAGVILDLCEPEKLTQFGFEWKWSEYDRDEPISTGLLDQLSRFPRLTDVHILFPRPETYLPGLPDPDIDPRTLDDVASIFRCNGSISRVGIGNSLVWERHPSEPSEILIVSDASIPSNPGVPKFYHAGYLARDPSQEDISDNASPPRPDRGAEIEQLRDLLQRILT
ncbi:hypothetical protein C8F04DRAFT_347026 [Mycena alexandri]|uniref:Uncharacterized protein n=1 Tax=Mycena alexandri TaxID=1745969 RepID=A0AAD6X6R0_9AGAR|nr:hypothetical protein C8F04DRAFT_347026 [Mycena alexandri]